MVGRALQPRLSNSGSNTQSPTKATRMRNTHKMTSIIWVDVFAIAIRCRFQRHRGLQPVKVTDKSCRMRRERRSVNWEVQVRLIEVTDSQVPSTSISSPGLNGFAM